MKDQGKDAYDIKKFQEVLDESCMMVPDSEKRRDEALSELEEMVRSAVVTCGEWIDTARSVLKEHYVDNGNDRVVETNLDDLADDEVF